MLALLVVGAFVATQPMVPAEADGVTDAEGDVLGREPQLAPQDLGADLLDGLQYPDPTAGLSLIEPPDANNQGSAQLAYPLLIPRGRAGVQPDLSLSYDSSGGNGWVGLGWDLGLGEVTIDTLWGVPRYLGDLESETYVLDGDVLSPTAVSSGFEPRIAERADFTRRVEGPYERIIRHGDHPSNYWWEVTDKMGTAYTLEPEYAAVGPHQVSRVGTRSYHHDLNGNGTGWDDDATGQRRTVTWDAEDRVTSVADQGSTTRYTYDEDDELAIERGPSGETSFVNRWYTVRNGTVAWKHVFADGLRVATQRVFADESTVEHVRLFLHADSLGSTNIVTDPEGLVFQHLEYFPSGEIWVQEQSDEHRTPYLFTGAYFDEFRELLDLGARWYDPREQRFLSPDPILYEDPDDVVGDPGLLSPYAYAQASPLTLVDPSGRETVATRFLFTASVGGSRWGVLETGTAFKEPEEDPPGSSSRFAPNNPIPRRCTRR